MKSLHCPLECLAKDRWPTLFNVSQGSHWNYCSRVFNTLRTENLYVSQLYSYTEGWTQVFVVTASFVSFFISLFQVSAEFQRLTKQNLEPKFMEMLDLYTPKLLSLFQAKKGAVGARIQAQMSVLLQVLKMILHLFNFYLTCNNHSSTCLIHI